MTSEGRELPALARKIRNYRRRNRLNQTAFAQAVASHMDESAEERPPSQSTVSRWESGSEPDQGHLVAIARLMGLTTDQLLSGEVAIGSIRVLGYVEAGDWKEAVKMPQDDQWHVSIPTPGDYERYRKFALSVRGPSMDRRYPPGSILVCVDYYELGRDPASGERVIVHRHKGDLTEATCKLYQRDSEGHPWLWPESTHPEHQTPIDPTADPEADEVCITAKVIGSYRPEP